MSEIVEEVVGIERHAYVVTYLLRYCEVCREIFRYIVGVEGIGIVGLQYQVAHTIV